MTVLQWCLNNSYNYYETSAKKDIGITTAMLTIAALALRAKSINEKNIVYYSKQGKDINLECMYATETKSMFEKCWDFRIANFFGRGSGGGNARTRFNRKLLF